MMSRSGYSIEKASKNEEQRVLKRFKQKECSRGLRASKGKSKRAVTSKDGDDVYCWCQEGEYGEMIACDNVACPIE